MSRCRQGAVVANASFLCDVLETSFSPLSSQQNFYPPTALSLQVAEEETKTGAKRQFDTLVDTPHALFAGCFALEAEVPLDQKMQTAPAEVYTVTRTGHFSRR